MDEAWAEVEAARSRRLIDEDGEPVELTLGEPASAEEIAELSRRLGVALPADLRGVLERARRLDGPLGGHVDLLGEVFPFEADMLFPSGIPIAADGFGNFWVADLLPGDHERTQVFYASHDPPIVLFQSASLAEFLHEAFRILTPPHESLIDAVHDDRLFDVWRKGPGGLSVEEARQAGGTLGEFAASLDDEGCELFDLREPQVGMGFAWGRHGPRTRVVRHGHERIWAVGRPPKRRGWFRRGS